MNGWMVLAIVLGFALLGALIDGVALADRERDLRIRLDRERADRAASARAFAVRKLLEAAHDIDAFAPGFPDVRTQDAMRAAARWIEQDRVPEVAGLPRDHDELRAIADQVHYDRTRSDQ